MATKRIFNTKMRGVAAMCCGALFGSIGCASLVGHWTGDELQPEMARDQFRLMRTEPYGKLVSADIRIQEDGSYSADLNYDGNVEQSLGTWSLDKPNYVTFVDKEGKSYGYAVRRRDDNTIMLAKTIKGTDATLTLRKQP
jgi:hypothetical protein